MAWYGDDDKGGMPHATSRYQVGSLRQVLKTNFLIGIATGSQSALLGGASLWAGMRLRLLGGTPLAQLDVRRAV